jgi:hypothetical protein
MATGNPDPVDVWAPLFLTYAGSGAAKFTKEQILADGFAITGNHCKLCDDTVTGSAKDHMRKHRKDLTAWLARKRTEAAKKSQAGLAAHRKEKQLQKEIIHEPTEADDE